MIVKALMVVTLISGAEYAVDMPSMKSCLENAKIVTEQSEMVEAICIPQADKSSNILFCQHGLSSRRRAMYHKCTPSFIRIY